MKNNNKNNNEDTAEMIGAGIGGVGTTAGIAVAASGASASAITGGLATIGGLVGGGMAAGIVLTAAAPVAIGAVGYYGVKAVKSLFS